MIQKYNKIFIAGHNGMVGSAIQHLLEKEGYLSIITVQKNALDLRNQELVNRFFEINRPDYVILAAAKVGGIQANINFPAQFIYDNLMIQSNIIHASYLNNVRKLVFLGSSCIYPKNCPQPMKEEYLLTGKLEPTNEAYALAKIAGLKMTEFYYKQYGFESINLMPCNLYGPNDSFDLLNSHVLSALVKRFVDAVRGDDHSITLWGSGIAKREFMHVDDLAGAILFMLHNYKSPEFINIGWGKEITIKELAILIASKAGFKGNIQWDATKPDGMLRKCLDVSRMKSLGFQPTTGLEQGVEQMIALYKKTLN